MSGYTLGFAEVGSDDTASVGGKGASLGELTTAGVAVPPGFVVTTTAFGEAMAALDPDGERHRRIARLDPDDLDTVARATAELRRRIGEAPLPQPLREAVLGRYRELVPSNPVPSELVPSELPPGGPVPGGPVPGGPVPVAVRSSATAEDGADASFAGLQDTYLWVRGDESLLGYLRRCWASLYSVESVTYRLRRGLPEDALAMGVVIQQMVDPRCAGVMFTRSPLTGDRSVVSVEAAWGLGSALVSGDVTPDRYVVNKVTREVSTRVVSCKLRRHRLDPAGGGAGVLAEDVPSDLREVPCLTDSELAALVEVARRVEAHYQAPQDIEWAIAPGAEPAGEEVFVLQSRPETVWARHDAAPVAPTRASALDHVLDVLGGRSKWA